MTVFSETQIVNFYCDEICFVTHEDDFFLEQLLVHFGYFILSDYLSLICLLLATGYVGMDSKDSIDICVRAAGLGERRCVCKVGGGEEKG